MNRVLCGFMALRDPDGRFCPSVPVYKDIDMPQDEISGMKWDDIIRYFDELVEKMAGKEREKETENDMEMDGDLPCCGN